jgi:hypothetical protein
MSTNMADDGVGVDLGGESNLAYSRLAESVCSLPTITNGEPKPKRVPRRVLHFSDGVLEEYSTDEEDVVDEACPQPDPIDPKSLPLMRRCWYHATVAASKSLAVADYCGEKLAWFLGITSPKYQYVLDEYKRRLAEEEEERQREEREREAQRKRYAERFTNVEAELESRFDTDTVVTVTMADDTMARPETVAKF